MKSLDIKVKKLKVWENDKYYLAAKKGSLDIHHIGMRLLKRYSSNVNSILDLGCGEGSRLDYIAGQNNGFGIDISKKAIELAKKTYPQLKFFIGNLESLQFPNNKFGLVYSAYVLEHLEHPEKVIREALRVLKRNGVLIFVAPNYGSPNRASPVYTKSRILKLLTGFWNDFIKINHKSELKWEKVTPRDNPNTYTMDLDTQIEPYLGSLISFLENNNCRIVECSSCWEEELPNAKLSQKVFKLLSTLHIYPFTMWGPHLVVVSKKIN